MIIKDSHLTGILAGIIIPVFFFGIVYGLNGLTRSVIHTVPLLTVEKMLIISIALNVLPFRYLFVKKGFVKTGSAMLFVTVILIVTILVVY